MKQAKQRLFVYGTLAPGRPNAHVLESIGGCWKKGSVRGRLLKLGWGSGMGYPAIELDPGGDIVEGHVFESEELAERWDELDAFEGSEYERVLAQVELPSGAVTDAYIYVARR